MSIQVSTYVIAQGTLLSEAWKRLLDDTIFDLVGSGRSTCDLSTSIANGKQPELVIFDVGSPDLELQGAIRDVRNLLREDARIAVVTSEATTKALSEAFGAGADGFFDKNINYDTMLESLRLVMLGEKMYPFRLLADLLDGALSGPRLAIEWSKAASNLSPREQQILRYITAGHSNKMIANSLDINEPTVKVHLRSILRKLGVNNRTQAAVWAVVSGFAEVGSDGNVNERMAMPSAVHDMA
jgi:two-component system, NarL family, nitrate/nitrite response regulator NarL